MSIDWDKVKNKMENFVSKAADKAGDFTREASIQAEKMTNIGKIKLSILQLKKKKDKKFAKIGKKTFELIEDEQAIQGDEEIESLREDIYELDEKIAEKEKELEETEETSNKDSEIPIDEEEKEDKNQE